METSQLSIVQILLIIWGVETAIWIGMIMYKKILENREDDQLFLGKAEEHMAREQRELVARLERLDKPILALGITSGVMIVVIAGVWIWRGLVQNL